MSEVEARQAHWQSYLTLEETPTYGTYFDRIQEYRLVGEALWEVGLRDDDLLVDVGAGSCDLDQWLRSEGGWRGKYLPVDGAVQGVDLHDWLPETLADCYCAVETLEHLPDPERMVAAMVAKSKKGVVVSTPNADTHDVTKTDPTHIRPIHQAELEAWGFTVALRTLNAGRGEGETMIGWMSTA